MLPATEEVVLHRVTLRGQTEAIASARAPLKTALEQSSWPGTLPGEFLFVRKIVATGTPREIAARAAAQARHLADGAVDGWSPAAPTAQAVRFRNHPSLLACQIRDLLRGTAPRHWYWRRWQRLMERPVEQALVSLLQEAPLAFPAVLAQLRSTPFWQPFWQGLGVTGGEELLATVAQATGWTATVRGARLLPSHPGAEPGEEAMDPGEPGQDLRFLAVTADDPRPLLAALVTLWQQAPARLDQPTGAAQVRRLARICAGEAPIRAEKKKQRPAPAIMDEAPQQRDHHQGPAPKEPPPEATPSTPSTPPPPAATLPKQPTPLSAGTPTKAQAQIQDQGRAAQPPETPALGRVPSDQQPGQEESTATEEPSPALPLGHNFITDQGGLFFLLNVLKLPTVRAQLPAEPAGAGWRWLHDLAIALGSPPEGALLDFLAEASGLGSAAEQTLRPRAPMEALARLGRQRYGDEAWCAATWRLPARLIATASHVDLHFRLDDARLAVRRVGLDVNPGWLPWLGRVVTFHYGSGLEPDR